jgi:hypothetical protein
MTSSVIPVKEVSLRPHSFQRIGQAELILRRSADRSAICHGQMSPVTVLRSVEPLKL